MIELTKTNSYKKELKLMFRRGKSSKKLSEVLTLLLDNANKGIEPRLLLPEKYFLHKLSGKYKNYWECHVETDWLLIFYLDNEVLRLELTGTHSDLF